MAVAEHGSGADITTVLVGEFAQTRPLLRWDHVGSALALLGASNHPSRVQLASGASALGFSTAPFLEVEGTLHHPLSALQSAEGAAHGGIGPPELLSDFSRIRAQSARAIFMHVQKSKRILCKTSQSRQMQLVNLGPPQIRPSVLAVLEPLPSV